MVTNTVYHLIFLHNTQEDYRSMGEGGGGGVTFSSYATRCTLISLALWSLQVDDRVILQTLMGERSQADPWLDDQDNRRLIELFGQDIRQHLRLEQLLNKLYEKNLIRREDMGKLQALVRDGKEREANGVLVLLMHRNSTDWFRDFMSILYETDEHHMELAKQIDPGFCQKKLEGKKNSPEEVSMDQDSLTAVADPGERNSAAVQDPRGSATNQLSGSSGDGAASTGMDHSGAREENVGAGILPQTQQPPLLCAGNGQQAATAGKPRQATCACGCCAQLLTEVSSLRLELAEMKSLIKAFVASGIK